MAINLQYQKFCCITAEKYHFPTFRGRHEMVLLLHPFSGYIFLTKQNVDIISGKLHNVKLSILNGGKNVFSKNNDGNYGRAEI
jgi:hypothetical protein